MKTLRNTLLALAATSMLGLVGVLAAQAATAPNVQLDDVTVTERAVAEDFGTPPNLTFQEPDVDFDF